MKIVFTSSGTSLDSPLEPRFGRAPRFLVYDTETASLESLFNESGNAAQSAGIRAAETVARSGAQCVVTGHCGPKAFAVLSAAGIKVYRSGADTVRAALVDFERGALDTFDAADVAGHWTQG